MKTIKINMEDRSVTIECPSCNGEGVIVLGGSMTAGGSIRVN